MSDLKAPTYGANVGPEGADLRVWIRRSVPSGPTRAVVRHNRMKYQYSQVGAFRSDVFARVSGRVRGRVLLSVPVLLPVGQRVLRG